MLSLLVSGYYNQVPFLYCFMRIFFILILVIVLGACVPAKKYHELLINQQTCNDDLQEYKTIVETQSMQLDVQKEIIELLKEDTTNYGNQYRVLKAKYQQVNQADNPFNSSKELGSGAGGMNDLRGKPRMRLANLSSIPETPHTDIVVIAFSLVVNDRGKVVRVNVRNEGTTTNNQKLIDEVKELILKEVKYEPKMGAREEMFDYNVTIQPN